MARKSSKKSAPKSVARRQKDTAPKRSAKSSATASRKTVKKSAKPAPPKAAAGALQIGDKAPAFTLKRDGDSTVRLSDFAGQKLVIFFYPRADTPGCTREAIDFTRLAGAFEKAGTGVLGMSGDDVGAQTRFRDKHELCVPLAADADFATIKAYGVWGEKSMYGKTFMGIVRTTVLVGKDGRIARVWRNVRVDGHADEVLEAARAP